MSEQTYPVATIAKLLILTERLRESLIPEDLIRPVVTAFVARFKQRTLAVAPKVAPMVAVESEADACHDIIETFLLEAFGELAGMWDRVNAQETARLLGTTSPFRSWGRSSSVRG